MNVYVRYVAICVMASTAWPGAGIWTEGSQAQTAEAQVGAVEGRVADLLSKIEQRRAPGDTPGERSGKAEAGIVEGHPYLANDAVAFVWAKPEEGGGLISIYDRRRAREFLAADATRAPLWQVMVKTGSEQSSYQSAGMPCTVSAKTHQGVGKVSLRWAEPLAVQVEAQLAEADAQVRMTIAVQTAQPDEGLLSVTFPVVNGILPLTREGRHDEVLKNRGLGRTEPSPAVTGKPVKVDFMKVQLTALLGDGRGLYVAEEDGAGNRKACVWEAEGAGGRIGFSLSHPVLGWGGQQPVREYRISGPVVLGPFEGDWFDVARIYRKWALTAPWCRKGPIPERTDYPQWFARQPFWTLGSLNDEEGIRQQLVKRAFYGLPNLLLENGHLSQFYHHDRQPEYLPPRVGSQNYARVVGELQSKGIRVVPYVMGYLWNMLTESYRTENAEQRAAIVGQSGDVHYALMPEPCAAMCPPTALWREKLMHVSRELVGRYGVDGIYFDYLTMHNSDCFNADHGHPLAGGNYWARGVHGLYEQIRQQCRKLNPEVMFCGEGAAEWTIDVLDVSFDWGPSSNAPVYLAIYHDYHRVTGGGLTNKSSPAYIGRYWLMGAMNGWNNNLYDMARPRDEYTKKLGRYYRNLMRCHWEFGVPFLSYGEMLRPPRIDGDLPTITNPGVDGPFKLKAVGGSAWLAADGTVGIFFLNYDDTPHEFTWTQDLTEIAGIGPSQQLRVTRWSGDEGTRKVGQWRGGVVSKTMQIDGWGLIALKLEDSLAFGKEDSPAYGEGLKIPEGCQAAEEAQPGAQGYADKIVHQKTGIELVLLPAGSLTMASDIRYSSNPPHPVGIAPFYMARTEVTNAQYRKFMAESSYEGREDTDPAYDLYLRHLRGESLMPTGEDYPIVWISWKNARAFCKWAGLALPSEAQWEYACRAGTTTRYYFGDEKSDFDKYGWALGDRERPFDRDFHTHQVAQKLPNAWGFYDMLGNVWEWVEDDYVGDYEGAPTDGTARVEGKMTRVMRGGSWSNRVYGCGARVNNAPDIAANAIGFRVTLPLAD